MAKKVCVICGKELGMFQLKSSLKDGKMCQEHAIKVGIDKPDSFSSN